MPLPTPMLGRRPGGYLPEMKRTLVLSVVIAVGAMSSCATSDATPTGGSTFISTGPNSPDSTINGRVAPDANGNNDDAPAPSGSNP